MTPAQYSKILTKARKLKEQLAVFEAELAQGQSELRKQVESSVVGSTVTLEFKNRVIKCKRNRRGRYDIIENSKKIVSDCFFGINEIRLQVALGHI